MAVEMFADVCALLCGAADAEFVEQLGSLFRRQAVEFELVEASAEEAFEVCEDEAAGENGEASVLALAEGGEELAQCAVEERAVARVLRPFLQNLQPVEHDDERVRARQCERGVNQVSLFIRLRRAQRLVRPDEELEQEVCGVAILVEAPR